MLCLFSSLLLLVPKGKGNILISRHFMSPFSEGMNLNLFKAKNCFQGHIIFLTLIIKFHIIQISVIFQGWLLGLLVLYQFCISGLKTKKSFIRAVKLQKKADRFCLLLYNIVSSLGGNPFSVAISTCTCTRPKTNKSQTKN